MVIKGIRNGSMILGLTTVWAASAMADDTRRLYTTVDLGIGMLDSQTLEYDDGTNVSSSKVDFDASFAGGATIGYRLNDRWAIEGAIGYRRNEIENASVAGLGDFSEADFASLSYSVSALYYFNLGSSGKLTGFAGPGLVYIQEIDFDFEGSAGGDFEFDTDDAGLQFKFGGRYDFSDRWFADAKATYLTASDIRMRNTSDRTQTLTSDYDHWTLAVGFGYRF